MLNRSTGSLLRYKLYNVNRTSDNLHNMDAVILLSFANDSRQLVVYYNERVSHFVVTGQPHVVQSWH